MQSKRAKNNSDGTEIGAMHKINNRTDEQTAEDIKACDYKTNKTKGRIANSSFTFTRW